MDRQVFRGWATPAAILVAAAALCATVALDGARAQRTARSTLRSVQGIEATLDAQAARRF